MKLIRLLFVSLMICLTQGCIDAAVTGAQVAFNHDKIQKTFTDQYITTQAYQKIYRDTDRFADANVSIATFHQHVLLAGQVPTRQDKKAIEKIINDIPDVKKVYNLTEVAASASALTRMSDVWITTKVKSKLIAMNDVDPSQIKVVTENGTVFLMGMVLPEQADIAIDVARNTDGVQNVVKLFSYLRISKT